MRNVTVEFIGKMKSHILCLTFCELGRPTTCNPTTATTARNSHQKLLV
jgi:hypothetical protein